jgi:hypothetical protein
LDNLVNNINAQLAKDGFDGQIKQSATAKSNGLDDLISSFFQGYGMYIGISVCACLCCCLLLVVALIAFGNTPAGQAAIEKGTNVASIYATGKMNPVGAMNAMGTMK